MQRLKMLICFLLCVVILCGCQGLYVKENIAPSEETTEPSTATSEAKAFVSYEIKVRKSELAVHSGPGYHYEITGYVTDWGTYTIIAEEIERLGEGQATVWGKLVEEGWINLEDAAKEEKAEVTEEASVAVPEEKPEETTMAFQPYIFKIVNSWLEIYSGPGYHYGGCGEIRDCGSYTIVEESVQHFNGDRTVTWGRLKSGAGWICLDDAKLDPEVGPPYRCTNCGRADTYISRYALCDDCHEKQNEEMYGTCDVCGEALDYGEYTSNDGVVCFDCLACEDCGGPITAMDLTAYGTYLCWFCYEEKYCCFICGEGCYPEGTHDGLCEDCYAGQNAVTYCTYCGVELNEENTAFEGFGKCVDCYYETLDPENICANCGADCSFRGSIDGLCEDCYEVLHGES